MLAGHSEWVRDVAFARQSFPAPPNTASSIMLASASADKTVLLWTAPSDSIECPPNEGDAEEANGEWQRSLLGSFGEAVWRLSWSQPLPLYLAVTCGDGRVTLWARNLDVPPAGTVNKKDSQEGEESFLSSPSLPLPRSPSATLTWTCVKTIDQAAPAATPQKA